ncbi:MAG: type IV pilus twitching motility protein PilT [Gemmatimonadales bacterium]
MPRLDRFLSVMREQSADAIRLTAGQPIALKKNGMVRPMTRDPLNEQQVLGLLKEIAPGAVVDRLSPGAEVAFTYDSPGGAIEVQVVPTNGMVGATLRSLFPPVARRAAAVAEPEPDLSGPRARIDELLQDLAEEGGSDLHLKCGSPPLVRKDGALVQLDQPPLDAEAIELMLRSIMSARDFGAWRQTGDADFAHEIAEVARFRGNAARDRLGPIAVFRVIPNAIRSAEDLGLSAEVQALCKLTKGLVLVTGPTGSGKSTTLAGLVDLVNRSRSDHVVTIEDPIEFVHQSRSCLVTQRQVGQHTASFKAALRAALREDPDVLLVGEMRDLETIAIAIETAETGHLVFGTLHTTTAASTVDRIIDQFPTDRQSQIRVMLAESLRGVVSQILCKKKGGGRVAAYEILLSTPAVANLIREGKTFQIPSIMQTSRRVGMVTMNDALLDLVLKDLVEPSEAYLRAADRSGFAAMLKAKGIDTTFLADG